MTTAFIAALAASVIAAAPAADPLADFAALATGTFTSQAQAERDPAYDRVDAAIVRIWPERTDGVWLYQEQAIIPREQWADPAHARRSPYFQRVSRLTAMPDGRLRRDTYTITDPARFVGFARAGYAGPRLTPADLGPAGCHTILERVAAGHWTGRIDECPNTRRGAVRMTSLGVATPDGFANWDRGFDASGKVVWGPVAGGYVFRRH